MNEDTSEKESEKLTGLDWVVNEVRELFMSILVFLPIWIVFTTFVFELRTIPSESMVPALQVGDRVAVAKYAYGYSRNSPAFGLGRLVLGDNRDDPNERVFANDPERGDVVVFKHPNSDKVMIKRLIGLPGDTIQIRGGQIVLNGEPLQREVIRRFQYRPKRGGQLGAPENTVEYRETLPNGVSYLVHDWPTYAAFDETPIFEIPDGHVFMIGDNRDNSEDSRAPNGHIELARQYPHGWNRPFRRISEPTAIGYVPLDHLMGRAETVLFTLYNCRKEEGLECAEPRLWRSLAREGPSTTP